MFGREKLECPGCGKVFRKKDMKTSVLGKAMPKLHDEYLCVDCSTRKDPWLAEREAKEELIKIWSSNKRSSEKLSRLISNHYTLGNMHEEFGEMNRIKNRKKPGELGYSLGRKIEVEDDKVGTAYFVNQGKVLLEIGRIEGKIFCGVCLKLQPFRTPTMEDLERERRKYDPEVRKKFTQRVGMGKGERDMRTKASPLELSEWKNIEIFAETHDICGICNYSNRTRYIVEKEWQEYKGLVAQYCGENGIEEPDIQNNSNNFCDNCGNTLKPTSKFCAKCGTPVS